LVNAGHSNDIEHILSIADGRLSRYKNRHAGERCVIIGNGPSLNKMDLSFLRNEITFGLNRIYLGFEKWNFMPTYYVSVNQLVLKQNMREILKIPVPKFLGLGSLPFIPDAENVIALKTVGLPIGGVPVFLKDPREGIWEGFTVTYVTMQLAYYMGFSEVVIIGADHHFVTSGPANQEVISAGEDPNHFHPEYFGKGVRWHLPDLHNSEVSYRVAKIEFESAGRRIIDATVDGKLSIFPKADYKELFMKRHAFELIHNERQLKIESRIREAERQAEEGDMSGALSESLKVTEQYPDALTAHNNLGVLYIHSGEYGKSLEHIGKALRIDPGSPEAVVNCANIFALAGEQEKVKLIYATYMQRKSVDKNIVRLLKEAMNNMGNVMAMDLKGLSPAFREESFKEMIVLISIGNLLQSGDYDEAIQFCPGLLKYPESEVLVHFQEELQTLIANRAMKKAGV